MIKSQHKENESLGRNSKSGREEYHGNGNLLCYGNMVRTIPFFFFGKTIKKIPILFRKLALSNGTPELVKENANQSHILEPHKGLLPTERMVLIGYNIFCDYHFFKKSLKNGNLGCCRWQRVCWLLRRNYVYYRRRRTWLLQLQKRTKCTQIFT